MQKEREIWEACDDLLAMGKKPREITGEAIGNRLRELGYKAGNLNYRYKYRDSWMAARGLSREDDEIRPSNKPIDIIERSAALFSKTIEDEIRKEYETRYQEAESKIKVLTENLAERLQVIEHLNNAYETLSQANKGLTQELQQQQLKQEEISHQLTEAKTRAAEYAEQLANNAVHYQHELRKFETTFETQIAMLTQMGKQQQAHYQETLNLLKEQHEKQRHHAIVEIDSWRTENQKLTEQIQQLAVEKQQLKSDTTHKNQQLEAKNAKLINFLAQQKTMEQQIKAQEQKVAELMADNKRFQECLATQQLYVDIAQQLTELRTAIEQLPKTLIATKQGKAHESKG